MFNNRRLTNLNGWFYIVTGLWPVINIRSFEAVTGRKTDRWLVKVTGLLLGALGVAQVLGRRAGRPAAFLNVAVPAILSAVDLWYAGRRRISRVYLLDALVEIILMLAWITRAKQERGK